MRTALASARRKASADDLRGALADYDEAQRLLNQDMGAGGRPTSDILGLQYEVGAESAAIAAKLVRAAFDSAKSRASAGDKSGALDAYEDALTLFAEHFASRINEAAPSEVADLCKQAAAEVNVITYELQTPAFESSLPVRDLLAPSARVMWRTDGSARASFTDRTMDLAAGDSPGLVTFGVEPPAPWQDIVLDLQFKIATGGFEQCLRSRPHVWCSYRIVYSPEYGYDLDKTYQLTTRLRGTAIEILNPEFTPSRDWLEPTSQSSRAGGITFTLVPGSRVIISRCTVKVLREQRAQ